ncbi:MAG: 50S ribosomal protein L3 [Candidatus Omnitrophota bacterium]|nr:50S ribosomal protein L3 [Candidatus Omnitrophota bacterium]
MVGLLGKKIGMTQIFDSDARVVALTAIEAGPCFVLETKKSTPQKIKLGFSPIKETKLKKPELGFFKKINVAPLRFIREIPFNETKDYKVGEEVKVDIFNSGDFVDVTGISIGKGFQGGMKRWHWKGGPQTHGSTSKRRVGSIGSSTTPGRVYKGHHMPGHMGFDRVTVQNLKVVKVDLEHNLLLLKGAVPGHKNSFLIIKKSKKKVNKSIVVDKPKEETKQEPKEKK